MSVKKDEESQTFSIKGIGKQIVKHLARLEIYNERDLLFHLPSRYQDRTKIQPMRQLIPHQQAVVEGVIVNIELPKRGRTKLLCELQDATGRIYLRFFHAQPYLVKLLKNNARLRCFHEVILGPKGLEMVHPEFTLLVPGKPAPIDPHLTPIYPATEGLSQYMLRKLTANALGWMQNTNQYQELFPKELAQTLSFPDFKEALQFIHRPPAASDVAMLEAKRTTAQKRLIFEELLAHRLSLLHLKQNFKAQTGTAFTNHQKLTQQFLAELPFKLTNAQARVVNEIQADLAQSFPMLRLVQGDVGSGKTVVAALAMLQAVENGFQAVLMAPTDLLIEQHYRNFKRWFETLNVSVQLLTGNVKGVARKSTLKAIADGSAQIILGTHALFQEGIHFPNMALVVVDEQHRFGVHQRAMLREKGMHPDFFPHQLIMTATPIPRTLAMSIYADLDCSVIDELPPGRTPIMTSVIAAAKRQEVVNRIRTACIEEGRQAYWVCPLIEESELIACQAATKTMEELTHLLPELKIGLVHGKMPAKDKAVTMSAFQNGEIQLLVATTVIEVGVDVPNASVMVIENAERLGLSQLHQLRGRVGRGAVASHCLLLYQYPLSNLAKQRLAAMRETNDGFKIAQRDLELRGPGEVLGTRQTGELTFKIADLMRDAELLQSVHQIADLITQQHAHLVDPLIQRWIGEKQIYGKV